jgi:hypothetical protein
MFLLAVFALSAAGAQSVRTFRFEVDPDNLPEEAPQGKAVAIVTPDIPEESYGTYVHDANPKLKIKEGYVKLRQDGTGEYWDNSNSASRIDKWGVLYENGKIFETTTSFYWFRKQTGLKAMLLIFHVERTDPKTADKYLYGSCLLIEDLEVNGQKVHALTGGATDLPFIQAKQ